MILNYNNGNVNKNGISFHQALTLLFIGLKLCGVIDWHWVWVLSPLWIMWSIAIIIALLKIWATSEKKDETK